MQPNLIDRPITRKSQRRPRAPHPPKFGTGKTIKGARIVEYAGHYAPDADSKAQHHYHLRCHCGNTFTRAQQWLVQAHHYINDITCGCPLPQRDEGRRNFSVPCIHDWGYNPRPNP
jgi:hypothetical protein